MKKFLTLFLSLFALTLFASPAFAVYPEWNITGTWNAQHEYNGTFYTHVNHITEFISLTGGGLTGDGGWNGYVNGSPTSGSNTWNATTVPPYESYITGNTIKLYYHYAPPAPDCRGYIDATINPLDGSLSGTWHDNCAGERSGAWTTGAGVAKHTCQETGFYRDGINMTAAIINPVDTVSGVVNATGCNIGIYYGPGKTGTVSGANVFGANYYGVVNHEANVNISESNIHDIGESPLNGSQHGVGIYFANVESGFGNQPACEDDTTKTTTGTIHNNNISLYQKGGIVVNCTGANAIITNNIVTGGGKINYIAQNGIQVSRGAGGIVRGNTISNNFYIGTVGVGPNPGGQNPPGWQYTSAGLLIYQAGDLKQSMNHFSGNQKNVSMVP